MSIIIISSKAFLSFFIWLKESKSHHFESRLKDKDPITLFAAFIITVLNVFGGLVHKWVSTALKLQIELLKLAFNCQVWVSIRPFLIQDFDAFKASLLSWLGIEAILDQGTLFNDTEDMWDIKDGTRVKELSSPDGATFWDGLKQRELQLLWSLSRLV